MLNDIKQVKQCFNYEGYSNKCQSLHCKKQISVVTNVAFVQK